jgi:hypothetical protein
MAHIDTIYFNSTSSGFTITNGHIMAKTRVNAVCSRFFAVDAEKGLFAGLPVSF